MRELYLVITNISKRANIIRLIHVATAYNCKEILIVGQNKNFFEHRSSTTIPTVAAAPIRRFQYWHECVSYLTDHAIRLIGIEIHPNAQPIEAYANNEDTTPLAILMGNEGTGLHAKQLASCHGFCRIPQYGGGTASLNVYVAASIVLYRLHMAAITASAANDTAAAVE